MVFLSDQQIGDYSNVQLNVDLEYPDIVSHPPRCPDCDEVFEFRYRLEWHHLWRHQTPVHVCSECNEAFRDKNELLFHHRIHDLNEIRHACEKCGEVFENEIKLRLHHLEHAKPKTKKKCNMKCKGRMSLSEHLVNAEVHQQASCRGCFSRKSFNIKHQKRNSTFECQYVACLSERVCQHGNARTLSL